MCFLRKVFGSELLT